jgi:hypothetical protein
MLEHYTKVWADKEGFSLFFVAKGKQGAVSATMSRSYGRDSNTYYSRDYHSHTQQYDEQLQFDCSVLGDPSYCDGSSFGAELATLLPDAIWELLDSRYNTQFNTDGESE